MSKTLAEVRARLSQNIGDYISEAVTTPLTTSTSVVSTNFAKYTTVDNYFKRWWCLITSYANIGSNRRITNYNTLTNTATVSGLPFLSDGANLATVELHRYNPDNYTRAINQAARELYPHLYKSIDWNDTLILGNHLPNSHFEDWTLSTVPDKYALSNITAAKTTTAGLFRGGTASAKVTATSVGGYLYCSGWTTYAPLLDLQGRTVTFRAWAYPEVANDATIEIYTVQADGTTQTLTSETNCPAGKWTLLELEDQTLNDNLVDVQFRFKVATSGKYVYFDNARVIASACEYLLPKDFQKGRLDRVYIQMTGNAEYLCDDVSTVVSQVSPVFGYSTHTDGMYLRLPICYKEHKIILVGSAPLEDDLSSETDTITIDDLQLLCAYAAYKLFEMEMQPPASDDMAVLAEMSRYWRGQAEALKHTGRMERKQTQIRFDK